MTLLHGVRTVAIILAAGAACAMVPCAWAVQAADPDTAAIAQRDLDQLSATLTSPPDAASDHDRDEAANRLDSRQSPEARAILLRALTESSPASKLSVAKAVVWDAQPDPALIDPLFNALRTAPTTPAARDLPDAAARALVTYDNPDVLTQLIAVVNRIPRDPEPLRRSIIHALGFSNEKRSAQALVNVLRTADETDTIRKAAADALTEMSGISDYGQDSQRWSEWLARNNQKSDADFRNDILARRAAGADQDRQQLADLAGKVHDLLSAQFQSTPAAQQSDFLLANLKSSAPMIRAQTASLIEDNVGLGARPAEPVRAQLRTMIGDSDREVRINTARALGTINDDASVEPLLAQLAQEKDGLVRAQLAKALGTIDNLEALPALIAMLSKDPSVVAATAAADAIESLGERMVKENSPLLPQAAQALREAFDRQPAQGGDGDFREALLNAMIPLKQGDLAAIFYRILRGDEPVWEIRRLAVKALGEIADPRSAAIITNAMRDTDPRVRVEAVTALGNLPNANEYFTQLKDRASETIEPDESVRDAAWTVLNNIMPKLTESQIQDIILLYKDKDNYIDRELAAQKALEQMYLSKNNQGELPLLQQNIGTTLMKKNSASAASAAADYFKKALDSKTAEHAPGSDMAIIGLRIARMKALLAARQYDEAVAFAADSIRDNSGNQLRVGSLIPQHVQQLEADKDYDDALKLIEIALSSKIEPPLAPDYLEKLRDEQDQIRHESGKPSTAPATHPG